MTIYTDEYFKSILLSELGFDDETAASQMKAVYERLNEGDINLGKLDVSKLDNKQLNCLMSINRALDNYSCRTFFNADGELVITTDYRYQEEHQSTRYRVDWMTLMIDFVFNKQTVDDE